MKIFINHIEKFIQRASLLKSGQKVVVAVSAGIDSMALLYVAAKIKQSGGIKNLRAFHINHGTRVENNDEQSLVEKTCLNLGIPLITFKLEMNPKDSNFELLARKKRYQVFFDNLSEDEVLFTAHHLDDSFEWSLLSQLKSSNQTLGIPVKNNKVRRPFLCVTKAQIRRFVKENLIPHLEDSSNKNTRFERNYLRETVIPKISKRFPNYLKHYAFRSNELAKKLNLSVFENTKKFEVKKDSHGGYLVTSENGNDFSGAEEDIRRIISSLSNKKRGVLSSQIEKLLIAAKFSKKGPLSFSGGVLCFISQKQLYFVAGEKLNFFKKLDTDLLQQLKNRNFSFHKKKLNDLKKIHPHFLNLVFAKDMPKNFPPIKNPHPLLSKSTEFAIKSGLWVNSLSKLLFHFERSMEIEKRNEYNLFLN